MNTGDLYKAKDADGDIGWNVVMPNGEAARFNLRDFEDGEFDAQDMDKPYILHDIADDTDIVFVRNLLDS